MTIVIVHGSLYVNVFPQASKLDLLKDYVFVLTYNGSCIPQTEGKSWLLRLIVQIDQTVSST